MPRIAEPEGTEAAVAAVVCVVPSEKVIPPPGPRIRLPLTVWLPVKVLGVVVKAAPIGIGPTGPCSPMGPGMPGTPCGPGAPAAPAVPGAPWAARSCQSAAHPGCDGSQLVLGLAVLELVAMSA